MREADGGVRIAEETWEGGRSQPPQAYGGEEEARFLSGLSDWVPVVSTKGKWGWLAEEGGFDF